MMSPTPLCNRACAPYNPLALLPSLFSPPSLSWPPLIIISSLYSPPSINLAYFSSSLLLPLLFMPVLHLSCLSWHFFLRSSFLLSSLHSAATLDQLTLIWLLHSSQWKGAEPLCPEYPSGWAREGAVLQGHNTVQWNIHGPYVTKNNLWCRHVISMHSALFFSARQILLFPKRLYLFPSCLHGSCIMHNAAPDYLHNGFSCFSLSDENS